MERSDDNPSCLYRRALGAAFDGLSPALKHFHAQPLQSFAQGTLCVTRGQGRLRQALAALMRLPAPGACVPVHLEVRVEGKTEWWIRDFGPLRLITRQWLADGLLIETAGPLRFGFRLSADSEEMRFDFARCWLGPLRLPSAVSPRVEAAVRGYEDGWRICVCISVPVLGMLTRYEGKVTPQC